MAAGDVGTAPLEIAEQLRGQGIVTDVNLLPRSMKAQFKSADRSQADVIIIVGETELAEGKVNVKNKKDNTQSAIALDALAETVKGILEK